MDRNSQLRTRAMRERDDKNPSRIYRFTLLRVKFPDGYILQGKNLKNSMFMSLLADAKVKDISI